jgi:hypothetical protein
MYRYRFTILFSASLSQPSATRRQRRTITQPGTTFRRHSFVNYVHSPIHHTLRFKPLLLKTVVVFSAHCKFSPCSSYRSLMQPMTMAVVTSSKSAGPVRAACRRGSSGRTTTVQGIARRRPCTRSITLHQPHQVVCTALTPVSLTSRVRR